MRKYISPLMRKRMALLINLAVLHISLILRRRKNRPKYEQRLFALICLGTGSQVPYLMMTPPYPKKKTMINNTSDPKRWDRSLLSCQKQYSSPWTSSGYPKECCATFRLQEFCYAATCPKRLRRICKDFICQGRVVIGPKV